MSKSSERKFKSEFWFLFTFEIFKIVEENVKENEVKCCAQSDYCHAHKIPQIEYL